MKILSRIGIGHTTRKPTDTDVRAQATRSVSFWLSTESNDETNVNEPLRLAREGGANAVRAYVESQPAIAHAMSIGGIADDLMNLAVGLVDWESVASGLISEAEVDAAIARTGQDA